MLRPEDDQILRLTPSFSWSGCHVVGSDSPDVGDLFVCKGGRSFSVYADRLTTWYIAVSNCATVSGIELRYRLEVRSSSCSVKTNHFYLPLVVLVVTLVERWTRDRKVAGSAPCWGAIKSTMSTQPSIPPG